MSSIRRFRAPLIGVVLSIATIWVVLALLIPFLTETRLKVNEMSAVRNIGDIHAAQAQFHKVAGRYARTLPELNLLLAGKLSAGMLNGYRFQVEGDATGYRVTAVPVLPGDTGRRSFRSDQSGAIRDEH